jgi:hypothetical protein
VALSIARPSLDLGKSSFLSRSATGRLQSLLRTSLANTCEWDGRGEFTPDNGGGIVNCQAIVGSWEKFRLEQL